MGVILPGVERDGIFPQFFRGIGTGRDFFLWEWDGRGLKIHSRVTLYCKPVLEIGEFAPVRLVSRSQTFRLTAEGLE